MKKKLLLGLGVGFCFSAFAQTQMVPYKPDVTNLKQNHSDAFNFATVGQQHPVLNYNPGAANRAVTKTPFTASNNAYGLIVTESNCLTANQQLNAVMFTHRLNNDVSNPNENNGFIRTTFSTDFGATWDSITVTNNLINLCRYPSGAIFNPSGNTDINNAFATVAGSLTPGAGWEGNYFASTKFDSTNINASYVLNGDAGVTKQGFARIGYTATDIKTIVTGGLYADDNGTTAETQLYRGATLNYATPGTANDFVWTIDSIKPNFLIASGGAGESYTITQTAWNKAGDIGYVIFNGVEATATGSAAGYAPIVYKTTDAGTTWNVLPLFDFSTLPAISATLSNTTNAEAPKAWFSQGKGFDAAVDENGELHIFCNVASGYSNHPDSLGYTYSPALTSQVKTFYMFDTYTTGSTWGSTLVDSLNTDDALDFSPFTDEAGAQFQIDARMQMSRSDDGSKLFFFWLDSTPDLNEQVENGKPNIFGKGYDVTNQKWTYTKKFTDDDQNYFMYISNIALQSGTNYKIAGTVSLPAAWPNDGNLINPMTHYFVSGLEFDQADFVGVKSISKSNGFEVTTNVPNPFDAQTSFNVSLTESSNVTVDIVNMLGAKVASFNKGNFAAGTHRVVIDGTDLTSGLYFYTVNAGGQSVTRKMIKK